jgi:hypothetical protein
MAEAAPKSMGRAPQLREINFKLKEQAFREWDLLAPHGTKFDDLLEPKYWAAAAKNLKPWVTITVRAEDYSFYAKLLVLYVEKFSAQVAKLEYFEIDKLVTKVDKQALATSEADYLIEFDGKNKWKCIRRQDRAQIFSGHTTKEYAEKALKDYLAKLGE